MTVQASWDLDGNTKQEYTKFAEGVTKVRFIDDVPVMRWTHWMQKHNRSANCPGKGCPICEIRRVQKANKEDYTYPMSRRFAMQVINRNNGKLEINEQGVKFYEEVKELRAILDDKGLKLSDVDISVRRRGNGTDTSYRLDIAEEYELTDSDKKLIENKVDLVDFFKPHTPEQLVRVINGEEWDKVMYPENEEDIEEDIEIK